jgi:hypothetical protein
LPGAAYTLQRTADFKDWNWHLPGIGRPGGEVVWIADELTDEASYYRLVIHESD